MMFLPISLKSKKPGALFQELERKQIKRLLDVRRPITLFSSAKYYYEEIFRDKCEHRNIEYIRLVCLSNRFKVKTDKFYFADPLIRDNLQAALEDYEGENVGVVCYCTEEAQRNDECHASWISNYLNLNLPKEDSS